MEEKSYIEFGSTLYRGFISDNLYHDKNLGEVHFSSYIPKSYDGSKPYALFITIPGWDGWLFWGAGANITAKCLCFHFSSTHAMSSQQSRQ